MTLELLYEFCCVARLQNITKAARVLYSTQSTISRHIADLEDYLDVKLIHRTNREFELTEAGRVFYIEMEAILNQIESVKLHVQKISQGHTGHLSITSFTPYIPYIFDKIRIFSQTHPDVYYQVKQEAHTIVNSVLSGQTDIGITFEFEIPDSPDLRTLEIGRDDICLIVPPSHPLATCSSVALSLIRNETILLLSKYRYPFMSEIMDQLMWEGSDKNVVKNIAEEDENIETMIMRIRLGNGIALLPRVIAQERAAGCILLGIIDWDVKYNICMFWRAENQNPVLQQFLHSLGLV